MASIGTYKAGCNFFWQDLGIDVLAAHVPLRRKQMDKLVQSYFVKPNYLNLDIVIALKRGQSPLELKGQLRRVTRLRMSTSCALESMFNCCTCTWAFLPG